MGLIVIGINHKTAPLKVRERFSFTRKQLEETMTGLSLQDLIWGVIILSTCNRMEIYIHSSNNDSSFKQIKRFLMDRYHVREEDIKSYFYMLEEAEAVKHIFRVSSGLDSQVLGERQILAQVKSARGVAFDIGVIGNFLDQLFKKAVQVGRMVRLETKISQGNISVGSIAIKMCEHRLGNLQGKKVLIIGAGKIGTLISKYFKERGVKGIFVSNRTYARATELAANCAGEAISFNQLKEKLKIADIVISSTASPHLVLKKEILREVMPSPNKPLLIMDLALPRDVEPSIRDIPNVALYDLDDLKFVVEENYNRRKKEVTFVSAIIKRQLDEFLDTKKSLPAPDYETASV